MKKIINRKTYNTDTAEKLGHLCQGSFGDPAGYEEMLFKTKTGNFFLYGAGGAESKYPEEAIIPITKKDADAWLKSNR